MEDIIYDGCLTLPQDLSDKRDFKASEAIEIDTKVKLPDNFSLGEFVYTTNYQGAYGSCTSNATSHGVQVLKVKQGGKKPVDNNIYTPSWRDLWTKMGHNLADKSDSGDYVEKAVETALKQGIEMEEGGLAKFDAYATDNWDAEKKNFDTMKRYLYSGKPIVWCMRGNGYTRSDLTRGELKSPEALKNWNGGHAICLVGWDKDGFWFLNSRSTNDGVKKKSRFHVPYYVMLEHRYMFNRRYWVLYNKEDAKKSPEYLKRKNNQLLVITALKKLYNEEVPEVKKAIEEYSKVIRATYPEINEELPLNS